jgi:hypothetical protein
VRSARRWTSEQPAAAHEGGHGVQGTQEDRASPFISTDVVAWHGTTPKEAAAAARSSSAACCRAPMGLAGGPRPGRRGSGRAFGLGPIEKDRFFGK